MNAKLVLFISFFVLALASLAHARHATRFQNHYEDDDDFAANYASLAGRRPHPGTQQRALSHKQGRVFPGALLIKKLVLLKFKKIVPISLILLRAGDANEAELVPVYPTSEIPANVQFIPTPNGISGHRDVQAIAIPSELHDQLELNGLANLDSIQALLNQAEAGDVVAVEDEHKEENKPIAVINEQPNPEDAPLNVKEDDVDQLLENVAVDKTKIANANMQTVRRLAVEDVLRPNALRQTHSQAGIEEIPLFLYAAKDTPQLVRFARKGVRQGVKSQRSRKHA